MSKIKLFLAALLTIGSIFFPTLAYAEEAKEESDNEDTVSWLQVAPVSNRVKLLAGSDLEYSVVVTNSGDKDLRFSAYAAPYTVVDEGYNLSFSNETVRSQIARWIHFINDDGSLTDQYHGSVPAHEEKTVNYRVSVPEDVPAGGQYGVILIQTEADEDISVPGVQTVSRVGMVIYGRTDGETEEKPELVEFNIPTFKTEGKITASSVVRNAGNVDFETNYSFKVSSVVGKELYQSPYYSNLVLPDTQRREEFAWETTPAIGIYQVTFKVEANGEVLKEETKLVIILPVYIVVITILLLTITIIWIIILIRKRKERKARLLV